MLVVNSVCGCAAGKARPGIAMALQNKMKPDVARDGVCRRRHRGHRPRAREYFTGTRHRLRRSGCFSDGKLVYMMERQADRDRATRR